MNGLEASDPSGTVCEPNARAFDVSVITLFPEAFPGILGISLIGQALRRGLWRLETLDLRSFASDKHGSVDDTPAGGGAGMVLKPDVAAAAIARTRIEGRSAANPHQAGLEPRDGNGAEALSTPDKGGGPAKPDGSSDARPVLLMSPAGRPIAQDRVRAWSQGPGLVVFCGRFEGLDQRVIDAFGMEEISVGDAVYMGGEGPAQCLIEAIVRLLPGVVGNAASLAEESFEQGLLEHPHYTRPRVWCGRDIPDVLMSGDHARIKAWRQQERERITRERRPDLWAAWLARKSAAQAGLKHETRRSDDAHDGLGPESAPEPKTESDER